MARRTCRQCGREVTVSARFCGHCGTDLREAVSGSEARASEGVTGSVSTVRGVTPPKQPMSRRTRLGYAMLGAGLMIGFLLYFVLHVSAPVHPVIENQPIVALPTMYTGMVMQQQHIEVSVSSERITFPLTALFTHKIVAFDVRLEGVAIPVFAYISPEGKVVTAVRRSEACGSSSFILDQTHLVCECCDTRWNSNNLQGIRGPSRDHPPHALPSRVTGSDVQLDLRTIERWNRQI